MFFCFCVDYILTAGGKEDSGGKVYNDFAPVT